MKIVLLCNYAPDAQQSMLRFGALLRERWQARGCEVRVIAPRRSALVEHFGRRTQRAGKWLGYLDKYVLFPRELRRRLGSVDKMSPTVVHVVDHSNALYVPHASEPAAHWIVTCHDLLAVRGALGEDTDCPASVLGRQLQRAIAQGLARAAAVACDSTSTLRDLERLVPARAQRRRVIPLGLSYPYRQIGDVEARRRLAKLRGVPWETPFLAHVGSNLPRKNKAGVLRVFARLKERWSGNLVFCGAELPSGLRAAAQAAGVGERVFAVSRLDDAQLEAVYNAAHALLFPSKCEGFGWPVIEAQACGAPVICSDRTSLPEVGGDAALVHALDDEAGMAESALKLTEPAFRAAMVRRGLANLSRFDAERMIDAYREVYEEVLSAFGQR